MVSYKQANEILKAKREQDRQRRTDFGEETEESYNLGWLMGDLGTVLDHVLYQDGMSIDCETAIKVAMGIVDELIKEERGDKK